MSRKPEKVLVIDDDSTNLALIDGILNRIFKVYPIASGSDALEFFEVQRPNLILLDMEMPEMSGAELFGIIKSNPELSDIPVVFLSGHDDAAIETEMYRLGADDFIRKPVNDVVLLAKLKMHLELASYRRFRKNLGGAARRSLLRRSPEKNNT